MTPVDVVTVWAPRRENAQWREDYVDLLKLQRKTVERFGHRHVVVTDEAAIYGLDTVTVDLPEDLMPAMIAGVIAWIDRAWQEGGATRPCVFVDADCLIARDLSAAFEAGDFDIGLLRRDDPVSPINNGAMYVAAGAYRAAGWFFARALALCGTHWGADQEAISQAAAPVPLKQGIVDRDGVRFAFLSMRHYGVVPKMRGARHYSDPFVVHFKGETKEWAAEYAERFILPAVE